MMVKGSNLVEASLMVSLGLPENKGGGIKKKKERNTCETSTHL